MVLPGRHVGQIFENAVAGVRIAGSNNFTFAATLDEGSNFREQEENGNVGSLDGPQPIDVVVDTSTDVKFIKTQFNSVNGECGGQQNTAVVRSHPTRCCASKLSRRAKNMRKRFTHRRGCCCRGWWWWWCGGHPHSSGKHRCTFDSA